MSIITDEVINEERGIYKDLNIISIIPMVKKVNSLKLNFKFEKNDEGVSEVKMMDAKKPVKKEKRVKEKKEKTPKLNK